MSFFKNITLTSCFVALLATSFSIPNVNLKWKCSWNNDRTYTVSGNNCHFEQSMTCKHWLWGTVTTGYEWTTDCIGIGGSAFNNNPPFEFPCDIGLETNLIAKCMSAISASGISVPDHFMNETFLASSEEVLRSCINFRLSLAGYDVNDPLLFNECYVPSITLPIVAPLLEPIPSCANGIVAFPNPASEILNLNLNGFEIEVLFLQIVNNSTGLMVLELQNPISQILEIDISDFTNGSYSVLIHTQNSVNSINVQIEN